LKNITITLDQQTAAWLRVYAAKQGMSVSRVVGDLLYERMSEAHEYDEATERFLASKPFHYGWDGPPPRRDEIHDRARAREDLAREDRDRQESK
jgi:hypothetical protein